MIREFLNDHWKPIMFFSLLLGLVAWLLLFLIGYNAAYTSPVFGEWIIQIDFNRYGEGPLELYFVIPSIILLISTAIYIFSEKINA